MQFRIELVIVGNGKSGIEGWRGQHGCWFRLKQAERREKQAGLAIIAIISTGMLLVRVGSHRILMAGVRG